MPPIDFNDAVRAAVADEIDRVLGPHMETLKRLSNAFGTGPDGRERRAAGPGPRRRGRPARRGAIGGRGDASKFKEGQKVRFKQGRGEFDATVTAIDGSTNTLTLKRDKDGKRVERPASKVYAA
jgi:hypothetical protein